MTAGVFDYFEVDNISVITHTARRGIDIASREWALVPFVELLLMVLMCLYVRVGGATTSVAVICASGQRVHRCSLPLLSVDSVHLPRSGVCFSIGGIH